ncbi:MAG: hypothetical protein EOO55_03710, partial [Hymenobacter sp.]
MPPQQVGCLLSLFVWNPKSNSPGATFHLLSSVFPPATGLRTRQLAAWVPAWLLFLLLFGSGSVARAQTTADSTSAPATQGKRRAGSVPTQP